MIELKNITLKYDKKTIFNNIYLKINKYDKVAITGQSGTGKTSLLNLIIGFINPQKGKIFVDNMELNHLNIKTIRKKIAWLPQGIDMYFNSVSEMFYALFSLNNNKKNKPSQEEINKIFNTFKLNTELMTKKVSEISGGQKQRILLASIILTKKQILLLDEPTSALDNTNATNIANYLKQLNATVICASHDRNLYSKMDYIINLDKLNKNE